MAIPKIPKDAPALVQEHRKLLQILEKTAPLAHQCRQGVAAAVAQMQEAQVTGILEQIPVEELNRQRKGIRVKTLRDSGFENLAQIEGAPERVLADIDGISDGGAAQIKEMAAQLRKEARQGIRIRLSLDEQTEAATELVRSVLRLHRTEKAGTRIPELLNQCSGQIRTAMGDLEAVRGGLRWLFASREKKERANSGYQCLRNLMDGRYGADARQALEQMDRGLRTTGEEGWSAFSQEPISFFQTVEAICPGALGAEDTHGLPQELETALRSQELALEGLRCQLRSYQQWGVRYVLHQKRVLLGDEMGLGKTVQAIAAMVALRNGGGTHFLVVCPASVIENWCREIAKHSDLTPLKIHGPHREEMLARWKQAGGVAVTTYETTGLIRLEEGLPLSMLVVDEAHYIKNPQAQRTANVRRLCGRADSILFMTGTALENKVDEMISLISVLQPQVADRVRGMASLSAAPRFRQEVAPVYYRRKREDVLTELPDLIENQEWCELGREEEQVYEAAVLGRRYAEARRVSWSAEESSQSSKAQRMLELIEEAREDGRKVIVFSFFLDTIRKVTGLLGDQCLEPINGSVSPQRRQEIVDAFNEAAPGTVLAAQIQAGGTGLNIQAASVVILCEPQFKPSIENQAISRAYRMGQTRNVLVYRLLCQDTVDERILEILEEKQKAFDSFADESVAGEESLDSASFAGIMEEEARRIREKNGLPPAKTGTPEEI